MKLTCEVKVNKYLYIRGSAFDGLNDITQLDNIQMINISRGSKAKIKDAKATHNCYIFLKSKKKAVFFRSLKNDFYTEKH